jgi:hypothetical protein
MKGGVEWKRKEYNAKKLCGVTEKKKIGRVGSIIGGSGGR